MGLTVQETGRPRLPRPRQPWLSRMQCEMSDVRPSRSFTARSGSASCARVSATMSAMPESTTSAASSTEVAAPTPKTGTSGFASLTARTSSRSHATGIAEGANT